MDNQGQVTFTDIATSPESGINYRRVESPREAIYDQLKQGIFTPEDAALVPIKSRGAPGVAVFDFDGDGDEDIYVTNGPGAANSLYSNQLAETGQVTFVDVATEAGVGATAQDSTGVSYADIDNDGDLDLLVLGAGEANQLFENQGDGTFIDITDSSNIGGGNSFSSSASFGDVNGDGLVDIVIANSYNWDDRVPILVEPFAGNEANQLLINQGDNTFVDASDSSGFTDITSVDGDVNTITWAIAMVDYDLDGDLDIIQADDQAAIAPEGLEGFDGIDRGYIQVFNNDGAGNFTNVTEAVNLDVPGSWMGLSFGDFNGDGLMDIFATNLGDYGNELLPPPQYPQASRWFLQQEDGTFLDSGTSDLGATAFGWGNSTFDYNNDGDTDIVYHGGLDLVLFVDASNPGLILDNDGTGNFDYNLDALAGSTDHSRRNVQGVAVGDLNGDGFEDIISVSNFDTPEPIPAIPNPNTFGSALDGIAGFVPNFTPTDNPNEFVATGLEFPDGTLSIELNSGNNGNNSVAVEVLGTVGLTTDGRTNRAGIGTTVFFTPEQGSTVINPVLGGSSYASQDSLVTTLGLGNAESGTVEVLWTGGVRNRLYNVEAGERLVFPEIPVSYTDDFASPADYQRQLDTALVELVDVDVLTTAQRDRFFASGVQAYAEENGWTEKLVFGSLAQDQLIGSRADEFLFGRDGNDFVNGERGDDALFGGAGRDRIRGGRGADQLFGGTGNDTLRGGRGRDQLFGGDGDDKLRGGRGQDILDGGLGDDTYIGGRGADTFVIGVGAGLDILQDFNLGQGDQIALGGELTFSDLTFQRHGQHSLLIRTGDDVIAVIQGQGDDTLPSTAFTTLI